MANTMKAAVVRAFGQPLTIEEMPVPRPGPGEVLVKLVASGVCHTDLHAADGDWPVKPTLPFIAFSRMPSRICGAPGAMSFPRLTPEEAAAFITDGQTVGFSGFTPAEAAKLVRRTLASRAREQHEAGRPFSTFGKSATDLT
jgi:hypothetical protein